MRLDRYLANAGIGSRREVTALIRVGRVAVGGNVVKDPSFEIGNQTVTRNGETVLSGKNIILAMYKPSGYISATEDKKEKTVIDLLPPPFSKMKLSVVGRLDKDTEGLLLLTSDGRFVHTVTSPKNKIPKVYYLETDIAFLEDDPKKIAEGVSIGEGESVTGSLTVIGDHSAYLEITEGKFHQVKRMIFALGKTVTYLRRDQIGKLTLSSLRLERGEVKLVRQDEIL